jgi:hypothetical protein
MYHASNLKLKNVVHLLCLLYTVMLTPSQMLVASVDVPRYVGVRPAL